ncbi:MAG: SpoIIE family protein phosphatase [Leptospiraceae bacterium]|nr:SpoIIE family protein phosphatase [Leptospiraceae bacterium]
MWSRKRFQFKNRNSELGGDICITGNLRFGNGKDRYIFFFNGDAMGKSMQGAGGAIVAGTVVNSILARSARNNKIQKISPREWITETYLELNGVFNTFDGSMLMSCACGVINEKTGQMWYFNAEHPWELSIEMEKLTSSSQD